VTVIDVREHDDVCQ